MFKLRIAVSIAAIVAIAPGARASASSDELVRQARAHEAAHDDDVAVRRYTEAIRLDPTDVDAWTGLGDLRMKLGEPAEAERVYSAALAVGPAMRRSLAGRARARWALGRHREAEGDLERYASEQGDADAYRQLSAWYGAEGRAPAQLVVWRTLLATAMGSGDVGAIREARRMVRALVVVVGEADPAAAPADPSTTRRALARIARRGI